MFIDSVQMCATVTTFYDKPIIVSSKKRLTKQFLNIRQDSVQHPEDPRVSV